MGLTKKDLEKLRRLKDDFDYYAPQILKIRTKQNKLVPFSMNPMQKRINQAIDRMKAEGKPVRIVVLKARQVGCSTLTEGRIFHDTAMSELTNSLIVAHKEDASTNLFNMSKLFHEEMPTWLQPMKKASNAKELIFENPTTDMKQKKKNPGLRSKIKIDTAKNLGAGRSETIKNLHISELAFWESAKEVMTGLMQSVPDTPDSMVIVESTANGLGGYFYDLCQNAMTGKNEFEFVFIPWFENPEYSREFADDGASSDFYFSLTEQERLIMLRYSLTLEQIHWRRWCIENNLNGDEQAFNQEYPDTPDAAFIASGSPVYPLQVIVDRKRDLMKAEKEPRRGYFTYDYEQHEIVDESIQFVDNKHGPLAIYEEPILGHPYVLGGDTAEGGEDYCGASVRNNLTWNQAAVYRDRTDTDLYAAQMYCLGKMYNDALISIEVNFDLHPVKELHRLGYPKQYKREAIDNVSNRRTRKHGFRTTAATRPNMISDHVRVARETIDTFNDLDLLNEMITFVKNDRGRVEAQPGCHDDLVIADAIALQSRGQQVMTALDGSVMVLSGGFSIGRPGADKTQWSFNEETGRDDFDDEDSETNISFYGR